jgi:hypothetical protein
MPDYQTHYEKYNHNKDFVSFGISNSKNLFSDWKVTATFYACIHLIEAILYKQYQEDSNNHDDRFTKMSGRKEFLNCLKNYGCLKTLAWTSRYSGIIAIDEQDAKKAWEYLEDIELCLRPYILSADKST